MYYYTDSLDKVSGLGILYGAHVSTTVIPLMAELAMTQYDEGQLTI